MARHIEFRHHADATIARVSNHVANFNLRVIEPGGAELLQFRKTLAFDAEALVIGEVPVKHIQLQGFHAIQVAANYVQGSEVARRIDHQPAPGKARPILNGHGRRGQTIA